LNELKRIVQAILVATIVLYLLLGGAVVYFAVDASNKRDDIAAQTARTDKLTQDLCELLSGARVASNMQLRTPLRTVLQVQANVLTVAARAPSNRGTSRETLYRSQAKVLRGMAGRVRDVGPIKCQFDGGSP